MRLYNMPIAYLVLFLCVIDHHSTHYTTHRAAPLHFHFHLHLHLSLLQLLHHLLVSLFSGCLSVDGECMDAVRHLRGEQCVYHLMSEHQTHSLEARCYHTHVEVALHGLWTLHSSMPWNKEHRMWMRQCKTSQIRESAGCYWYSTTWYDVR